MGQGESKQEAKDRADREREWRREQERHAADAERQAQIAEQERRQANKQAEEAERQRREATQQAQEAERQRREAAQQIQEYERQRREADRLAQEAERERRETAQQAQEAEQLRREADRLAQEAERERQEAAQQARQAKIDQIKLEEKMNEMKKMAAAETLIKQIEEQLKRAELQQMKAEQDNERRAADRERMIREQMERMEIQQRAHAEELEQREKENEERRRLEEKQRKEEEKQRREEEKRRREEEERRREEEERRRREEEERRREEEEKIRKEEEQRRREEEEQKRQEEVNIRKEEERMRKEAEAKLEELQRKIEIEKKKKHDIAELRKTVQAMKPGDNMPFFDETPFPKKLLVGLYGTSGIGKTSLLNSIKFAVEGDLSTNKWFPAAPEEFHGGHTMMRRKIGVTKTLSLVDTRGFTAEDLAKADAVKVMKNQIEGRGSFAEEVVWTGVKFEKERSVVEEHRILCTVLVFSAINADTVRHVISKIVGTLFKWQGRYPLAVITHVDTATSDQVNATRFLLLSSGISDIYEVENLNPKKEELEPKYQVVLLKLLERCMFDGDAIFQLRYEIDAEKKRNSPDSS